MDIGRNNGTGCAYAEELVHLFFCQIHEFHQHGQAAKKVVACDIVRPAMAILWYTS